MIYLLKHKLSQKNGPKSLLLRVFGLLLYQLRYRVNWEQYACLIHFVNTRDSHENLTLYILEGVSRFDSMSELFSGYHEEGNSCHPKDDSGLKSEHCISLVLLSRESLMLLKPLTSVAIFMKTDLNDRMKKIKTTLLRLCRPFC